MGDREIPFINEHKIKTLKEQIGKASNNQMPFTRAEAIEIYKIAAIENLTAEIVNNGNMYDAKITELDKELRKIAEAVEKIKQD